MGQHIGDHLQVPDWLNDQFLLEAIRKAQNDPSLTLCHGCKLRPGINIHDGSNTLTVFCTAVHYRSARYRKEQAIGLIVKLATRDTQLDSNGLLESEMNIYGKILPAMSKALKEVGEQFEIPRLIYASSKPHSIIILEDMSSKGWQMNQELLTNFEDALLTVRYVAKLHATSYFLNQTSMDLSKNCSKILTEENEAAFSNYYKEFDTFCDAVQKWPNSEKLVTKIKHLKGTAQQMMRQIYTANSKGVGYNVLNHGSASWMSLLHKKSFSGQIKNSMLTDFQSCHWGSPAIDVISLLNLIVDHDTKKNYRNEIVYEYYRHFVQILNKLGFLGIVPTLADLHVEIIRRGFLEVFHVVMIEQLNSVGQKAGHLEDTDFNKECYMNFVRPELHRLMYKGLLN